MRILKGFSEEFEKRKLPFIAVMHAPDHTNDDRNWHFHLVYHDRPVKRFTGDANDHMWELQADAGSKKTRQHEILKSTIGAPELKEHIGKWDFMVPWKYRKPNRHTMTTYPFTQDKDREVNGRKFIPSLRKKLAELTNRELEAAKKERRLDPRKYSEMGIHKAPDIHLGTKAARLESLGIPTDAGAQNEENQWNFIQENLANRRAKTEMEIDRKIKGWTNGLNASDVTDAEREKAEREMVRWEQESRRAAEHHAIALNLKEHYERLESRAMKLKRMAEKHIKAIAEKRATPRQANNLAQYQMKLDEANGHLMGLKLFMANEFGQIISSEISAKTHGEKASASEKLIESIISGGKERRQEKESAAAPTKSNTAATPKTGKDAEGSLTQKDVANYIDRLLAKHARIIEKDGVLVPAKPTPKDLQIIANDDYQKTQLRLGKLKATQDKMISDLVEALQKNPRMIVAKKDEAARKPDALHSERYSLATKNRRSQQAFRMFANEPEIVKALDGALAGIKAKTRDLDARRNAAKDQQKTDTGNTQSAAKPSASKDGPIANVNKDAGRDAASAPNKNAEGRKVVEVINLTRDKHLRPQVTKRESKLEVSFSRQDVALYRVPETLVIEDERSISRMQGIVSKHDRAVKRLVAYLAKNPSAVREPTDSDPALLSARAPKELRTFSENYARDPQVRRAVEDATIKARLEAADPRKMTKTQSPASVDEAKASSSENKATDKPSVETNSEKPISKTKEADVNAAAKATSKENLPKEKEAKQAPASTPAQSKSEPEAEQPGLFSFDSRGRLVRKVEPTEAKEYGARKISGKDSAAEVPEGKKEQQKKGGKEKRKAIIDDSQMDLLGERTYERTPTRKLEKGINPKIDKWIEAEEKKDLEARRKAAAVIRGDRHLLSIVDEMDPQVRARLQRDWDGIDDRNKRTRTIEDRNKNVD